MSIELVHTNVFQSIPVRYQSSAERRNVQNTGSFQKYNPALSHCPNVPSLLLSNSVGQATFTGVLFNISLSRGERGTQKTNLFAFALQGCSQNHFQTGCSLESCRLSSFSYFLPREKAVTDCR